MPQKDLTLDVNVLMDGSGIGNNADTQSCYKLMVKIEKAPNWFLALDKRGQIRYEYDLKIRSGVFAYSWLQRMYSTNKIKPIAWQQLNRGLKTELQEAHFDGDDLKYIRTAIETESKIIVSYDPGFSGIVRNILRRRQNVCVKNSKECFCLND